jgi:integrase
MSEFSVSIYTRTGSPYWWARCYLAGEGGRERRWSTGIRHDGPGGKRGSRRAGAGAAEEQAQRLAEQTTLASSASSSTSLNAVAGRMLMLKAANGARERTVESLAHTIKKHVEPALGTTRDVRTIRRADLEAFKQSLVAAGYGAVTVNNCLTAIRQVLKHAANVEELLETLPHVANVRVSHESKGRALTEVEVGALLSSVDERSLEARHFLEFVVNTGMRKTETMEMRWGWIDWEGGVLDIPAEYRKGGRGRRVMLNDAALELLDERRRNGTKFRGGRPAPLPSGPEDRVWVQRKHDTARNSAAERAGLGRVRTHDLRHTRGSMLYAAGASLPEVRDELGHASMAMVNRYAHSYDERRRATAQRVQIRSVTGVCAESRVDPAHEGTNSAQSRKTGRR